MGIEIVKCGGELFIDDETMHRAAFCILSELSPLYRSKAHTVGNLPIPEVAGELARRMKGNGADHALNMVVVGDVLYDDSAPANYKEGFEINMDWLEDNILSLPATSDHTRAGKLVTELGDRTNLIQVYDFQQGETTDGLDQHGIMTRGCLATLYIRIPKGKLEL